MELRQRLWSDPRWALVIVIAVAGCGLAGYSRAAEARAAAEPPVVGVVQAPVWGPRPPGPLDPVKLPTLHHPPTPGPGG